MIHIKIVTAVIHWLPSISDLSSLNLRGRQGADPGNQVKTLQHPTLQSDNYADYYPDGGLIVRVVVDILLHC